MGLIWSTSSGTQPATSIAFSRAKSRPTCRSSADEVRACDQSQDCQGARAQSPGIAARPRRRVINEAAGFIAGLGSAATWPFAARAQPTSTPARIGFLSPNTLKSQQALANFEAFRARLRELGLGEGQNFIIDYKDNNDDPRGLSVAAVELVQARPDVIVVTGPEGALQTVISAKPVVPIVMIAINYDPIARGYVTSCARPGGNRRSIG